MVFQTVPSHVQHLLPAFDLLGNLFNQYKPLLSCEAGSDNISSAFAMCGGRALKATGSSVKITLKNWPASAQGFQGENSKNQMRHWWHFWWWFCHATDDPNEATILVSNKNECFYMSEAWMAGKKGWPRWKDSNVLALTLSTHRFICAKYLQDSVGLDMVCEMTEKRIFTMASHVASALVSTLLWCFLRSFWGTFRSQFKKLSKNTSYCLRKSFILEFWRLNGFMHFECL